MQLDGIDVVLNWLAKDFQDDENQTAADLSQAAATAESLDALESRIESLKAKLLPHIQERLQSRTFQLSSTADLSLKTIVQQPKTSSKDWSTIRRDAEERLRRRGINPASVSLDNLLDSSEVERIERRFHGEFTLSAHLDSYDVVASVVAGLVAALTDFLIVRIPKDIKYLGQFQEGSLLTKWLHSLSIPSDNWLAQYFKTSYDRVKGVDVSGFNPKTHRLQTFGHDPLIGLVIGTIDIMRGGLTAISREGEVIWLTDTGTAHYNPFTALVWQIMHLLSDGFTEMGLPPPGWSLLQLFQVGSFGQKEHTVAELARNMYLKGYDSRHFLTMGTSVAAAEVILRGYFWIRRKLDEQYDADIAHLAEVAGARNTGSHPRFQAMAFAAHMIASAANAGKVAIYAGNPLAINYAQWLRFFQAALAYLNTQMRSPSEVLIRHARANLKALEQGWLEIDVEDASFPTLVVD